MVTEDKIKHYLDYLAITFACTADQETWLFLGLSPIDACLGRTYAVPFSATETGWQPINASNRLSIAGWMNGTRTRYALQGRTLLWTGKSRLTEYDTVRR